MTKSILFIADPWNCLDHARDSSLHLARVAIQDFGLRCYWTTPAAIFFDHGELFARLEGELHAPDTGVLSPKQMLDPREEVLPFSDFHSVHWRKDPPVDLLQTRLWSLAASTEAAEKFVNPLRALLAWNEKFAPHLFGPWAIPTFVSDSENEWRRYLSEHSGRKIIVKPVANAASRGVSVLPGTWAEACNILRELREAHGPWIVFQEFDDSVRVQGEARAFFLSGQIRAALRKTPHPDRPIMSLDTEENFRPRLELCTLDGEQQLRAAAIARALTESGVHIATIDFIGPRILEINVTSPGLLSWIDAQEPSPQLAKHYWEAILK
ncbi:MAG: hypothetical protein HYW49_09320 [Deltaproteobacteria bacterium]|nr:hypothetical protein [Deltaproteobacteria bacterium]